MVTTRSIQRPSLILPNGSAHRVPATSDAVVQLKGESWGWFPILALMSACGLLLVATAYTCSRFNGRWLSASQALLIWWMGLLIIFLPIAARLLSSDASRRERLAIVLTLGIQFFLVEVLSSPIEFVDYDELIHWHTADDILRYHHLFHQNPMLPVSSLYPGLESVTSALINLSGMSIFHAGVTVLAIVRILFVLALFLLFEEISGSSRIAGIASLIYMTNSHFLFFDAQFIYESLALPFAVLVLFAVVRSTRRHPNGYLVRSIAAILGTAFVIVTHHVASYMLVALLGIWTLICYLGPRLRLTLDDRQRPGGLTLLAFAGCLTWLLYIAVIVVGYLALPVANGVKELIGIILREQKSRELFQGYGGQVNPLWERLLALASVGFVLLLLPFGLFQVWFRHRSHSLALALAAAASLYPVVIALRLTQFGGEIAGRSTEYLFVAIAFVLAVGITNLRDHGIRTAANQIAASAFAFAVRLTRVGRRSSPIRAIILVFASIAYAFGSATVRTPQRRWRRLLQATAFIGWAGVLFAGGVVTGVGPTARVLPGPYRVSADSRSVEPQSVDAAEWARAVLGPDNRIATDRVNKVLMGAYGEQYVVNGASDHIDVSAVILEPQVSDYVIEMLKRGNIRYVVIDRRLSTGLPVVGVYVEEGEPDAFHHTTPVALSTLVKFDGLKGVRRVFDSGDIVIYDVSGLQSAPGGP